MKKTFEFLLGIIILFGFCLGFIACSDDDNGTNSYIELVERSYTFPIKGETRIVDVHTNVQNITAISPSQANWATFSYTNSKLTIVTEDNNTDRERKMTVRLNGGKDATTTFEIIQYSLAASINQLGNDIKLTVKDGTASSQQSDDSGIDQTFDGDMTTMYHSKWDKTGLPITLIYNFEGVETMDYILYKPRLIGVNGNFKEFDLYVSTESNPDFVKYDSYDFKGASSVPRINFETAIEKPKSIKFIINSGEGGFVSCAEMEFYQKVPVEFDLLAVFTDRSCSQLNPEMDRAKIDEIPLEFYRNLALDIFENRIDREEFRVQEYRSWIHPDIQATANKTAKYSLRDNPTGIHAQKGKDLIVMAEGIGNKKIKIIISNPQIAMEGSSYFLQDGLNVLKADLAGLVYVLYHTDMGTEPVIKLNFVSGEVNGYFDSQEHKKEDWVGLLNKATFRMFDLVGKYAHMTFETEAYKQYTPDGLALIDKYDDIVRLQQELMGIFGTDRQFRNRMYLLAVPDGYMYAGSYHTGYNFTTQSRVLNVNQDPADFDSWWGVAHEIGHINQTRPGLKWIGMGEVTNNIFSQFVVDQFGIETRLSRKNSYEDAYRRFVVDGEPHNARNVGDDVLVKLVPFWQLKLYMHSALGNNDFYPKVFETIRNNPNPNTDGQCQIEFMKICSDIAQLDLTDFFQKSGFLTPIDIVIDDYDIVRFTITQKMIDDCKKYIAEKKYPKPAKDFSRITDKTVQDFK